MFHKKAYFVVMGIIILLVFSYVSFVNILPNRSSHSYLSSDDMISVGIENIEYFDGKLVVTVTNSAKRGCIKSTRTDPDIHSKCWIDVENGRFSSSIYRHKKYYLWIMDDNNKISKKYEYKVL